MEKSTAKHCRICGVELTAENSTGKNPTLCTSCREKRRRDGFMTRMRRLTGKEPEFKEPEEAAPEEVFEGPKTFVDPEAPVQSPEEERPDLSGCSDLELKDELISRGWEVNCTKTQVITL